MRWRTIHLKKPIRLKKGEYDVAEGLIVKKAKK